MDKLFKHPFVHTSALPSSLPLCWPDNFSPATFAATGSHEEGLRWIENWQKWPACTAFLYGPSGCGKSHLAHIWSQKANVRFLSGSCILADDSRTVLLEASPSPSLSGYIVEDIHQWQNHPLWFEKLFHLWEICKETYRYCLFSSALPPYELKGIPPELLSRFSKGLVLDLSLSNDHLLAHVLEKRFRDVGILLPPTIKKFYLGHMVRSLESIGNIINFIQKQGTGKGISLAVAKASLEFSLSFPPNKTHFPKDKP